MDIFMQLINEFFFPGNKLKQKKEIHFIYRQRPSHNNQINLGNFLLLFTT